MNPHKQAAQQDLALNCADLAREIAHGPQFFDDYGKPTAAVERYNGARVTSNQERCALAGALRLLAYSDRKISEVLGCDVRSIPIMVREAERAGRIPALKERLQALVAQNAEQSSIVLADLLDRAARGGDSLELSAMIKAVGTVNSFAVDKHQLLTGAATEILEVRIGAGQAEREAWAKANAIPIAAEVSAVDSDALAAAPVPQQIKQISANRHTGDTLPGQIATPSDGQVAAPAAIEVTAAPPGGGIALPPDRAENQTV